MEIDIKNFSQFIEMNKDTNTLEKFKKLFFNDETNEDNNYN